MAILYGPLLNQLAGNSFIDRLVFQLFRIISLTENELQLDAARSISLIDSETKKTQLNTFESLKYWLEYFFSERTPVLQNEWFTQPADVIQLFISQPQPWYVAVFFLNPLIYDVQYSPFHAMNQLA